MTEKEKSLKIMEYEHWFNEFRKQKGENWLASTAEDREWYNESKALVIRNESSIDMGSVLPWSEILVFAPDGTESPYKMTRNTWTLIGLYEGYDRLSYEANNKKIMVTVHKNRMTIKRWGSRKKRKMLKNEGMRLIEGQISAYYGVAASMRFRRGDNAYVICLKNLKK